MVLDTLIKAGRLFTFLKIKEYNYFLHAGLWNEEITFALIF